MVSAPVKAASLPSAYCSDTDVDLDKSTTADSPDHDCVTTYKKQIAPVCWAYSGISAAESSLLVNYPSIYKAASLDLSEYHLSYYVNHLYNNGINLWNPVYPGLDIIKFKPKEDLRNTDEATVSAFSSWVGPAMEDVNMRAEMIPMCYSKYTSTLPDGYATGKTVSQLQNAYQVNVYDIDDMKKMIMQYGAGTYSYYFEEGSWGVGKNSNDVSETALYYNGALNASAHSVCIIGWDDNYSREYFYNNIKKKIPQKDGAWLVKDSSAPDKTEWVSYENVTISARSTFFDFGTPQTYKSYEYNYQYDSCSGNVEMRDNATTDDSTAQMGNIFTAQSDITVKAAGFYTYGKDTKYQINIYKKTGTMKDPTDGTLVSTYSDSMNYGGYHVVSLPERQYVKLKKGEQYSVVIDIHDPKNGNPLISTGFSLDGRYHQQTYSGVSFYRFSDQSGWIDQGGNSRAPYIFRIKAFADSNVYSVSTSSDSSRNAAVVCKTSSVETGQGITFQVVPSGKYPMSSLGVLVNGKMVTGTNGTYAVNNIDEDIVICVIDPETTFQVKYDANTGVMTDSSTATYTYGIGLSLPTYVKKEGYTFLGWELDGSYHTRLSPLDYGDKEYTAGWAANTYAIHYDANGGQGNMADSQATYDTAGKLSLNKYTYSGKSFAGWNTRADGSGTFYGQQEKVLNLTAAAKGSITLYAQWTSHSYHVCFDANGGEGVMNPLEVSYGTRVKLSANEYTKTGYNFAGWNAKADGTGASYGDMEEVISLVEENGGSITLYAQWNPITYTIHFDGNGFAITNRDITAVYDTPVTLPFIYCSSSFGYVSTGWSEKKDADRYTYNEKDSVSNLCSREGDTITLYVVYRALTYDITYQDRGDANIDSSYYRYSYGTGMELPTDMTKNGYVFEGWYSETDEKIISSISPTMHGDRTLVGMWRPSSYSITYHTCIPEDVVFEHQDYYYYGDTYTLPVEATAKGYTFLGWQKYCWDIDFIMGTNIIEEITSEDYGDIDVYAKWQDENGNLWLPQSMGMYEGSIVSPTQTPGTDVTMTKEPGIQETKKPILTDMPVITEPVQESAVPGTVISTSIPGVDIKETDVPVPSASGIPAGTLPPAQTAISGVGTTDIPTTAPGTDRKEPDPAVEVPSAEPSGQPQTKTEISVSGLKYIITGKGKATVTGCTKKNRKTITIPATIIKDGVTYKVTAIGESAFSNMKKLKSVVIGKNITAIRKKAFYHDSSLKKVTIQSSKISKWGKQAYKGVNKAVTVNVPAAKKRAYKKGLKASGAGSKIKIRAV